MRRPRATITCDHPRCPESVTAPTTREAARVALAAGWALRPR